MSDSLENISAMSLFVEDLQATKSFYPDVFDVRVVHADEVSATVKFDKVFINLLQASEASGLVGPGRVAGPRCRLALPAQHLGRRRGCGVP